MKTRENLAAEFEALVQKYGGPPPPSAVPPHLQGHASAYSARLRRPRIKAELQARQTRGKLKEAEVAKKAVAAKKAAGHYVPPAETVEPKPAPAPPADLGAKGTEKRVTVDEALAELRAGAPAPMSAPAPMKAPTSLESPGKGSAKGGGA